MNEKFKNLLNSIDSQEISVPGNLINNIVLVVDQKAKQTVGFKTLGLILVSFVSVATSVPIISHIFTSFTQSGFYNYLSIIFSDSDVALVYWKEILISLAESLPVIGIVGLLTVTAIFVWSILKAVSITKNGLLTA